MTLRCMSSAVIAVVLSCSVWIVASAGAQTRDASLLPPEQSGVITVAGCLQLGGKNGDRYLLANPQLGPLSNVPKAACNDTVDHRALDLQDTGEHGINPSMLGHWVEINGKLERETDDDLTNLREITVRSFRLIPVLPPPVLSTRTEPRPEPRQQAAAEPAAPAAAAPVEEPIGTSGQALPQTASMLPVFGMLGLLSLAGGFGLRLYRSQKDA